MPDDNQQPIKPTPAPAVAATPAPAVVVAAAPIKMPEPVHEMTSNGTHWRDRRRVVAMLNCSTHS